MNLCDWRSFGCAFSLGTSCKAKWNCPEIQSVVEEGRYAPECVMVKFLLWCVLLFLCWPLALAALVLYPIVWLILLPFRIVGVAVGGVLELVKAIIFLPARLLQAI